MAGLLKLITQNGTSISSFYYKKASEIDGIIKTWREVHGRSFDNYFIHAIPKLNIYESTNPKQPKVTHSLSFNHKAERNI